jgi:arsenate reductase (thioredoxin)
MYQTIQQYIEHAVNSFDSIPSERKQILAKIAGFVAEKLQRGESPSVIYVCTHNSRRSHFGQIWGKVASVYYGIKNVRTYSAGTEATAFNPNAIRAIQNAGFTVTASGEGTNRRFSVSFDYQAEPVICFSKTYLDGSIPQNGLCAVMTCTEADGNCPFIPGTELRIACPYNDPKAFDGTAQQDEKYDERCKQIAIENLYIFSLIKNHK